MENQNNVQKKLKNLVSTLEKERGINSNISIENWLGKKNNLNEITTVDINEAIHELLNVEISQENGSDPDKLVVKSLFLIQAISQIKVGLRNRFYFKFVRNSSRIWTRKTKIELIINTLRQLEKLNFRSYLKEGTKVWKLADEIFKNGPFDQKINDFKKEMIICRLECKLGLEKFYISKAKKSSDKKTSLKEDDSKSKVKEKSHKETKNEDKENLAKNISSKAKAARIKEEKPKNSSKTKEVEAKKDKTKDFSEE